MVFLRITSLPHILLVKSLDREMKLIEDHVFCQVYVSVTPWGHTARPVIPSLLSVPVSRGSVDAAAIAVSPASGVCHALLMATVDVHVSPPLCKLFS